MSVRSLKSFVLPAIGTSFACAALALLPTASASAQSPRADQAQLSANQSHLHGAKNAAVRLAGITYGHNLGGPARISRTAKASAARSGFNIDGQNWSGAAAQGSGFSTVTSNWTEPSVSCNSTNDLMAPWVGIDGYGSSSVEQTGVATDCSTGSPEYSGWYEMYPAAPVYYDNPVAAGDSISASVSRSGTSYALVLTDNTQGWSKTFNGTYNGANASAEVIIESPTGAYPSFGSVDFSGSTIDGSDLAAYSPDLLDASNASGFEDHTSAVTGGSFSISYEQE